MTIQEMFNEFFSKCPYVNGEGKHRFIEGYTDDIEQSFYDIFLGRDETVDFKFHENKDK